MLKRNGLGAISIFLIAGMACSTATQKYPTRAVASLINYNEKKDPISGKTFWEEYSEAGVGLGSDKIAAKDVLGLRLKVIFKWVRANPIAMFEELRARQPILLTRAIPIKNFDGENNGTALVSLQKDVKEVLDNPKIFSVRDYTKKMETSVGPFMLGRDVTPLNTVEKPWMRKMMPPEDGPRIREIVKRLTLAAIHDGTFNAVDPDGKTFGRLEVVNNVARLVPLKLTGEYFGFPGPDLQTMARWSKATQSDYFHNVVNDPKVTSDAVDSGKAMQVYIKDLIRDRKKELKTNPNRDDILSRLLTSGVPPQEIINFNDYRIGTNILGTLIGGVETTEAAIVQSMEQLFAHPDHLAGAIAAAKANDDALLSKYVWEALRFNPVNPFVVRYAEQDYVLGVGTPHQTKIAKGTIVLVGTMSAMFDETVVKSPLEFNINRNPAIYYHLGYGMHRCLGDMVSEIQVPEIIKQLLLKDQIRPASGFAGQVRKEGDDGPSHKAITDFTSAVMGHDNSGYNDTMKPKGRGEFPESFVVEYDNPPPQLPDTVQVAHSHYAFEDYLMDFDRAEYRSCLSGTGNISNLFEHFEKDWRQSLFLCRLKPAFRGCMKAESKSKGFDILDQKNAAHVAAFAKCDTTQPLTRVERSFYKNVMLGKPIDIRKVPTTQARRTSGWTFEDVLKFYDRYDYRETFMSPAAPSSFPQDEELIFYARLPFKFRFCIGPKVLEHKFSGGQLGLEREPAYEKCKDGAYSPDIGRFEGGLSRAEKFYYETIVLGKHISYSTIKD